MSGKEKFLLLIISICVLWFSFSQAKALNSKRQKFVRQLKDVGPKKEALELLSITQKRLSNMRKVFVPKNARTLQQIIYDSAKKCKMKVVMVVPKKGKSYFNLTDESISVQLEGTYGDLICFVKRIESVKGSYVYISGLSVNRRSEHKEKDKKLKRYYMEVKLHRLVLKSDAK